MSTRYLSLSLLSSIKGEDRFKEGITQDRRDSQDFSIFVHSSCSVLYLLYVFSLRSVSYHSIIHYLNHLAWQPSQTQQSHLALKRCTCCQPQLSHSSPEWQQHLSPHQRSTKRQHWFLNQCRASQSLMPRMRSSAMILKFKLFVIHSVRWSQLRRIRSCSVSWTKSGSTQSHQEKSTCSSASSSLKWQIILNTKNNSGTITQQTSCMTDMTERNEWPPSASRCQLSHSEWQHYWHFDLLLLESATEHQNDLNLRSLDEEVVVWKLYEVVVTLT